jgi:apolipoprotein N-acyltransferase
LRSWLASGVGTTQLVAVTKVFKALEGVVLLGGLVVGFVLMWLDDPMEAMKELAMVALLLVLAVAIFIGAIKLLVAWAPPEERSAPERLAASPDAPRERQGDGPQTPPRRPSILRKR